MGVDVRWCALCRPGRFYRVYLNNELNVRSEFFERKNIDKHLGEALQSHFLIAEGRIRDLEIEVKNLKTKLVNFQPIDPNHPLDEGDMIRYKRHGDWHFCTITAINDDELELETDEGEIIEVSRQSNRLRLLQ